MSRRLYDKTPVSDLKPIDWWLKPLWIAATVGFVLVCKYVP